MLILTARDTVEDKVLGLDSGANDYLVKPFAFAELLARLRVLSSERIPPAGKRSFGPTTWNWIFSPAAWFGGRFLRLTGREFELLEYLLRHKDDIVTRDMISLEVWKETTGAMTNSSMSISTRSERKPSVRVGQRSSIRSGASAMS